MQKPLKEIIENIANTDSSHLGAACFTGPRPAKLFGYDMEKYYPMHDFLVQVIDELYDSGIRTFISGGAQGFDQVAFWSVYTAKKTHPDIQNIVYIPYEQQSKGWKKEGLFGINEYNLMLKKADSVRNVSGIVSPGSRPIAVKALMDRNKAMVDDSDVVIGLFPHGSDYNTSSGGTAACLRYASGRRPVLLIDPEGFGCKAIPVLKE